MKKHVKKYFDYFNFTEADFVPCEVCEARAVDVHHIEARGMGGGRGSDCVSNLMALCRRCHIHYGDKKQFKQMLKDIHEKHIVKRARLN